VSNLTEKSSIPLFAALASLPVVFGGIFWLSSMYASISVAEIQNNKQDVKIESTLVVLLDIRDRIIRLEEKLIRDKQTNR